mgnify:CR=1 FL=1
MDDLKERLISARQSETDSDRKRLLRSTIERIEELEQRITQIKAVVSASLKL